MRITCQRKCAAGPDPVPEVPDVPDVPKDVPEVPDVPGMENNLWQIAYYLPEKIPAGQGWIRDFTRFCVLLARDISSGQASQIQNPSV